MEANGAALRTGSERAGDPHPHGREAALAMRIECPSCGATSDAQRWHPLLVLCGSSSHPADLAIRARS